MAQLNVSLPDGLKDWADRRVADGSYDSTSDYVCELVQRDQEALQGTARLQAAIDEGRASGASTRNIEDIIAARRAR